MKTFTSRIEGQWTTPNTYAYTEAELELLKSENPEDAAAKEALLETVKAFMLANPTLVATAEETASLDSVYAQHKPEVKEGEFYKLIAVDAIVTQKETTGIINYRIGSSEAEMGNHYQIKF